MQRGSNGVDSWSCAAGSDAGVVGRGLASRSVGVRRCSEKLKRGADVVQSELAWVPIAPRFEGEEAGLAGAAGDVLALMAASER